MALPAASPSAGGCGVEDQVGRAGAAVTADGRDFGDVDITFKGQHTDVNERFRTHAAAKLGKFERMDQQTSRVDVEVCLERNPRLASQKERVELTIRSRGPAIRAEAAAEDRFAALDLALAKLESRLRRALDRRKNHYVGRGIVRLFDLPDADEADSGGPAAKGRRAGRRRRAARPEAGPSRGARAEDAADEVPIPAAGDGPLLVRQKFHQAAAMTIDQALLEMELVGHDFYLFSDADAGLPSVVYRRRGYQYGVLRLLDAQQPKLAKTAVNGVVNGNGASRTPGTGQRKRTGT